MASSTAGAGYFDDPRAGGALGGDSENGAALPARCTLGYVATAGALLLIAASVTVLVFGAEPFQPFQLALAIILVALSLAARIPLGIGRDLPRGHWGELGLVASCVLVPLAWVPVVALTGALLGYSTELVSRSPGFRVRTRFAVASTTIATALGIAAIATIGASLHQPLKFEGATAQPIVMAVVAATVYFLTTALLAAAWSATGAPAASRPEDFLGEDQPAGTRIIDIALQAVRAGAPVMAGATLVGIASAVVMGVDVWWLAAMIPLYWLLHLAFTSRAESQADRRTLSTLAEVTLALQASDDREVRPAAMAGARQLFVPDQVELVTSEAGREIVTRLPEGSPVGTHTQGRALVVGGLQFGELRLRFRRAVRFTAAERDAFLTYAGAVAAALHDVATHRRLRSMTEVVAHDTVHDSLTGLSNRYTLLARGNAALRQAARSQTFGLLLINVNDFRDINDAMGHAAGDAVLRTIGRRLAAGAADKELVGYLGGDEFVLLVTPVPGADPAAWAAERANALTEVLAEPAAVGEGMLATEVSVGVVVDAANDSDLIELLRRADLALRQARREGTRACLYNPASDPVRTDRLVLLADLRDALASADQLTLYVEPTIDLTTGMPVGAEALVYWNHPVRGLLGPDDFVGLIEHSEMAGGFSSYSLDLALSAAAAWSAAGIDLPISVNLCARCTANPEIPDLIHEKITAHGLAPHQLLVEVSEGALAAELSAVNHVVQRLRADGVRVCVDDFGTASGSLSLLTTVPVDEIKIDAAFVAAMGTSPETDAIIRATVDLARRIGMRVVARGVERADQRAALEALGVDRAQGPLFQAALPASELRTAMP